MQITLLCNAGLALKHENSVLLVDALNGQTDPFCALKEEIWQKILNREAPFENVSGLYFTHEHLDHYDTDKVEAYLKRWPQTPVFIPSRQNTNEILKFGMFEIQACYLDHAPMDEPTPPHVVSWIRAGDESVYISADAKLDVNAHRAFLSGRKADVAFWNSMYLSQPATRLLLKDTARKNYIYHMPENRPDNFGLWRKCEKNLQRYENELDTVTVIDQYPCCLK